MILSFACQHCGLEYLRPRAAAMKGTRFCSDRCRVAVVSQQNRRPLPIRFWEKVEKAGPDDCWIWTGGTFADGYGAINVDGVPKRAPRVSYELSTGPIPKGLRIRHSCDNPLCVNPAHLIPGTAKDNSQDMVARQRQARNTKLTDEQVQEIRHADSTLAELAATYGVSVGLIGAIRGKRGYRVSGTVTVSRRKERHTK